jgi:hypothetical protein
MQGILSEFFTIEKWSILSSKKVIALDKKKLNISRSIRSIFNPQVMPRLIALPRSGTNIKAIKAHVNMRRFGYGKLEKDKETIAWHENMLGT